MGQMNTVERGKCEWLTCYPILTPLLPVRHSGGYFLSLNHLLFSEKVSVSSLDLIVTHIISRDLEIGRKCQYHRILEKKKRGGGKGGKR